MSKVLENPDFRNEAEEAAWWDDNQGLLTREFEQAAADGTLTIREQTPATAIYLDLEDIELAKLQAKRRGLTYQSYIQQVLHQALLLEAKLQGARMHTL